MEITKDMLIGELIRNKPEAVETLMRFGMGCIDAQLVRWKVWKKLQWFMV